MFLCFCVYEFLIDEVYNEDKLSYRAIINNTLAKCFRTLIAEGKYIYIWCTTSFETEGTQENKGITWKWQISIKWLNNILGAFLLTVESRNLAVALVKCIKTLADWLWNMALRLWPIRDSPKRSYFCFHIKPWLRVFTLGPYHWPIWLGAICGV